jgi:DNA-binding LytR/AlgR family response regulator
MDKKRILIVEDENIIALELMERLISLGYIVEGVVNSGKQAIDFVKGNDVSLVLMDIRLQGEIDGVDAAKQISELKNVPIIYLTAHSDDKTLERAKSTNVYGYVIKPINEDDLRVSIEIGLDKYEKDIRGQVPGLNGLESNSSQKKVQIWKGSELLHFNPSDIEYLKIESGVVCFYIKGQEHCQRGTLKSWEKKLKGYHFFRCHKSYIVNTLKVRSLRSDGANAYIIEMENGKEEIPLARDKYSDLKEILQL